MPNAYEIGFYVCDRTGRLTLCLVTHERYVEPLSDGRAHALVIGMGVYRIWRDAGYAVGTADIGLTMEFVSMEAAFHLTVALMFASGAVIYPWMEETHPEFGAHEPVPADSATPGH